MKKEVDIPAIIHSSWHPLISHLFADDRMDYIRDVLLQDENYYPHRSQIFRVFSMPIADIKVVILGQDPYPREGHANGLAFAVNEDIDMPPSLSIIRQEIVNTCYWSPIQSPGPWNTLEYWHQQGVFLLNTALTVKKNQSGSHIKYWKWFTSEVIRIIDREAKPIFMLWGSNAREFERDISAGKILRASHPIASAYGGKSFIGCNHFVKVNEILSQEGKETINF